MLKNGLFSRLFEEAGDGTGAGGGGGTSLRDSVLKAFAESEKAEGAQPVDGAESTGTGETEGTGTGEGTGEGEGEGEGDGTETYEVDASPDEIRNALSLFRSLANPETAGGAISELARIGGYDLTKKAEAAQLQRDVKTVLKEKLGDSYEILGGDRLADALDTLFKTEVEKATKPVVDRLTKREMEANQAKADTAMDALWARHKITDAKAREKVAGQMLARMKSMPASADANINDYLDDIYHLTTRDAERARTVKTTVRKIAENAHEVSRTSGEGSGVDESRVRSGSKLPSIREAVAAAFRGEKL